MMHPDEFTLLRYAAGDLESDEQTTTANHLTACYACQSVFSQLEEVDRELGSLAAAGLMNEPGEFDASDPFCERPGHPPRRNHAGRMLDETLRASDRARPVQERLVSAISTPDELAGLLSSLSLDRSEDRFGLLYALQEAGRSIAQSPHDAARFAREVLHRLQENPGPSSSAAEAMVPWVGLVAQAHVLSSLACMWTKEFAAAQAHLEVAYRSFGEAGDDTGLAIVELTEAQRRAFTHDGLTALALARRARTTFEARGLEDLAARAMVAEGLSHFDLDDQEAAVAYYRDALPIFERYELWSNYVGTLNSIGTSLVRLGRVDEARREYARALRRFSRQTDLYWLGYLRTGLAETLLGAGRHAEAAVSAARAATVFHDLGLRANALVVSLLEVESWARHGDAGRARHRLGLFFRDVEREQLLDSNLLSELDRALSTTTFERLAEIRHQVEEKLQASGQ